MKKLLPAAAGRCRWALSSAAEILCERRDGRLVKGIALSALKDRDDPRIDPNPGILHKP